MANELPGLSSGIRRFAAAAAMAVTGAVLIAGCAAGQDVQTIDQRPPVDGASTDAGPISIRTASVAAADTGGQYAKGADALLRLVIINNGTQQVQLVSVSSPAATSAQVSSAGVSQTLSTSLSSSASETGSASASSSATASGSASGSGSATSSSSSAAAGSSRSATGSKSASPSGSASASPSGSESSAPANTPISIPAGQSIQVGFSPIGPNVSLIGLTTELFPAQSVPVTFTFSDGSTVNLSIPVQLPSSAPSAPVVSDATEPAEPNN